MPKLDMEMMVTSAHEGAANRIREIRLASISDATRIMYTSRMGQLRKFADALGLALSKEVFESFVAAASEQWVTGSSSAEGYWAAMKFFQCILGEHCEDGQWSLDPDIKALVTGVRYVGKRQGTPRGSISKEMVDQCCTFFVKNRLEEHVRPLRLLFWAALRISQLGPILVGDWKEADEEESAVIILRKDKRVRATSRRSEMHSKPISEETLKSLKIWSRGKEIGSPLFPEWCIKAFRAALKQASTALEWPEDLSWCPHSLRHGGTRQRLLDLRVLDATVMSTRTAAHYGRTNVKRRRNNKK